MSRRLLRSVLIGALIAISAAAPLAAALQPREGDRVAAIFSPSLSRDEALVRVWTAGGVVLARGAFGSIVIAERASAGFIGDLRAQGAWAVVDARLASVLCGVERR